VAVSWQHPEPEIDAERQWREAITHAVMEIADRLGACQHHSGRVHEAFRRLALQREWMADTGGES
jgi:hypothetical protein